MRPNDHKGVYRPRSSNPKTLGSYRLLERLGEGGLGEVFVAMSSADGTGEGGELVAIKRVFPEIAQDEEVLSILFEEASSAQKLRHPNISEIVELGHVGVSHFIVAEYVSGQNLEQLQSTLFHSGRVMPISAALFIIAEASSALDFAQRLAHHRDAPEMGLLHHDLIPQNVLVSYGGDVKVTDFSVGRSVNFLLQGRTRILKRRYGYMPPEQIRGQTVDHRSDLFSLGVLLYELLTGTRAFRGENDLTTLDRVRRGDVVSPSAIRPDISIELERVVLQALASEPDERFQLARDLRRALIRCLSKESPSYTARDLASWMKTVFAAEIECEATRLDQGHSELHLSTQPEDHSSSWPPPIV